MFYITTKTWEVLSNLTKGMRMFGQKMVDFGNHRRFTLRCLNCGLIPVKCKLKNLVGTPSSYKIIKRAEKQLMNDRIRNINYILYMLKTKMGYS